MSLEGDEETAGQSQAVDDLHALLSVPAGRRHLWRMLEMTGLWSPSFSTDAAIAAHNEGRRSVGIDLMVLIQREAPNRWIEMVQEALGTVR